MSDYDQIQSKHKKLVLKNNIDQTQSIIPYNSYRNIDRQLEILIVLYAEEKLFQYSQNETNKYIIPTISLI